MIYKIAWQNIWRNKTRSLVVIGAIILGVWAVIFLSGISVGMGQSYIDNAIENEISHIQIHHPEFQEDNDPKFLINDINLKIKEIKDDSLVKAATSRTIINGMIASSRTAKGIEIRGINPEGENYVTSLGSKIIEGEYLNEDHKTGIIISQSLAEKLKVDLRKKVTLQFQDTHLDLVAGAFRVVGIFDTNNGAFNDSKVFVLQSQLNNLLGIQNSGHEIAILVNNFENIDEAEEQITAITPGLKVQSFREISPEIELFYNQISMTSMIFTIIVMIGLIFGIINTMLMAVLERIKEIGMLMAIGMNKLKVFFMIVIETIFLGLIGLPFGILAGYGLTNYLSKKGLNLSAYSDAMKEFNMSDIVYPVVNNDTFITLAFAVLLTSILASIYPAIKAIQLKPVEAIRKI